MIKFPLTEQTRGRDENLRMIRNGPTARAPYRSDSLAPAARMVTSALHSAAHVLHVFLILTDLVVFHDAQQVSS